MSASLRTLSLLLLLTLDTAPPDARENPAPKTLIHDRIGVEVVNIDVFVTDQRDHPVVDLTREDFVLKIDGREVPIANFYGVTSKRISHENEEQPTPPGSPMDLTGPAALETRVARSAEPLHLVVYFDTFYLSPGGRKRVFRDLPAFLEGQLESGTRLMLISHGRGTHFLNRFTTDLAELEKTLLKAEAEPVFGMERHRAHLSAIFDIQDIYRSCVETRQSPCDDCFHQLWQRARAYSETVAHERSAALAALEAVVNGLSVLEGRKALLHVSDGIEQNPGIGVYHYITDLCPSAVAELQKKEIELDRLSELNQLAAYANRSRVTLYTLEAAGLRLFSASSAEFEGASPSPQTDSRQTSNLQDTLFFLADETGGKAILNTNRPAPELDEIAADFSSYYSLGYLIDHPAEGESHRIAVRVRKNDVRVRYRRSFLHKSSEQRLADKTMGALLFGAIENPLDARIRAGTAQPGPRDRFLVPIEISVPYEKLTLLPQDGGREGRLTLIVAAPDEKGKKTAVRRMAIPVDLPPGDDVSGAHTFGFRVELGAGSHRLGLGIWDEFAATGSFLGFEVRTTG